MSGITNTLIGGKKQDSYNRGDAMSPAEDAYQENTKGTIDDLMHSQSQSFNPYVIQDQTAKMQAAQTGFDSRLNDFLSQDNSPTPNQAQIGQAQDYVDKTFTNPSQVALDQYQNKFDAGQEAKAAALGRNPNSDQSTNQAEYNEGLRNQTALQAQRGAQVAQTAQQFNTNQYNRGLQNLAANQSGINTDQGIGSFVNGLNQQAFSNQFDLLNQRSNMANYYQNQRLSNRTQGGGGTSSGWLTNATSVIGGANSLLNAGTSFGQGAGGVFSPQQGHDDFMGMLGGSGGGGGGGKGGGLMSLAALA